ncbi:MAG: hypothetical protein ACREAE_08405, partial [Nitrosopumilaceae archaeon]
AKKDKEEKTKKDKEESDRRESEKKEKEDSRKKEDESRKASDSSNRMIQQALVEMTRALQKVGGPKNIVVQRDKDGKVIGATTTPKDN